MSSKLFDLSGRIGLVTGSARGLENALAEDLAEAGATIVLNGQRAEWQTVIDTNLTSAFLVGREATRRMIKRGRGGKIINIGWLTSEAARATTAPYTVAKGGIKLLSRIDDNRDDENASRDAEFRRLGETTDAGASLGRTIGSGWYSGVLGLSRV